MSRVTVTIKPIEYNLHPVCVSRKFFPSGSEDRANRKAGFTTGFQDEQLYMALSIDESFVRIKHAAEFFFKVETISIIVLKGLFVPLPYRIIKLLIIQIIFVHSLVQLRSVCWEER